MNTHLSATALMFALVGLAAANVSCGVDSDVVSSCRFQSTISHPFPPDALLEESMECSTGTCVAYGPFSFPVYSISREDCEAAGGTNCYQFASDEYLDRYVYCTCRCPDECACDGDGLECRTVETAQGVEEGLCLKTR